MSLATLHTISFVLSGYFVWFIRQLARQWTAHLRSKRAHQHADKPRNKHNHSLVTWLSKTSVDTIYLSEMMPTKQNTENSFHRKVISYQLIFNVQLTSNITTGWNDKKKHQTLFQKKKKNDDSALGKVKGRICQDMKYHLEGMQYDKHWK